MKRLFLIILISTFVVSCSDLLDKGGDDIITNKSYWNTAKELKLYVNQFYTTFGKHVHYLTMDQNSDNIQGYLPSDLLNGDRRVPPGGGGWSWKNIRSVNIFFQNVDKVTKGSQFEIDQYTGEAYFFRALFYFKKLKRFGKVPIYKKPLNLNSEGLKAPRAGRQEVIDFIIEDLDKAIDLLETKGELNSNRVNKASALLLKSRVSLYEGTWEKYHFGTSFGVKGSHGKKYIKIAAQAASKLMSNENFGIYSTGHPDRDYYNLFNRTDLINNPEAILWTNSKTDLGTGNNATWRLNGTRKQGHGMTKQLVDVYLCTDGQPISVSSSYQGDDKITQVIKNRDPRLQQTMWVPGQTTINDPEDPLKFSYTNLKNGEGSISVTGYMIRKGSTTDPSQNRVGSSNHPGNTNGFIFRYAEALLNYAEAKAELGTITQQDLNKSVNLLRKRVGMPKMTIPVGFADPNWNFPNLSPVINEIRRERRVELALGGYRYDDLMRWAAGDLIKGMKLKGARLIIGKSFPALDKDQLSDIPVDNDHYVWRFKETTASNGFGFDSNRDYLFPIPKDQLVLNPNLDQNPGWE